MAQGLGRLQEAAVRQHQRAREVVGQADARELARRGVFGEGRHIRQRIDLLPDLQQGQLRGQLEGPLPRVQRDRQAQRPRRGIEGPLALRRIVRLQHPHAMLLAQAVDQPVRQGAAGTVRLFGEVLRGDVNRIEVVLVREEEVAHHFEGHRARHGPAGAFVARVRGHGLDLLQRRLVAPVQRDQRAPHGRHLRRHLLEFGQRDCLGRISQGFLHARD